MKNNINFLKAIADKNRLLILYLLNNHTLCVCDIQKIIPLTQGAVSIQLKNLTQAGLLNSFKQGKWVFYKLSRDINSTYIDILNKLFSEMTNNYEVIDIISKLEISETCKI
jgi:ArsR family transcriptional regulator